jgi:hypothetical protein
MWTQTDAVNLKEYLGRSRANLLYHLKEIVPTFSVEIDSKVEGIALRGAYKEGFLLAIQRIEEMSIPVSKQDDAATSSFVSM